VPCEEKTNEENKVLGLDTHGNEIVEGDMGCKIHLHGDTDNKPPNHDEKVEKFVGFKEDLAM
jgi:hypothetical protein